ncbi:DUF1292 domain-containing protein [Bacillaceae bacterium]
MEEIEVGEVIALSDEESGEERDFRVMYMFDIEDRQYLVLVPVEQEEDDEYEVHFLRYDGSDTLHPIESDEEWDMVEETFNTLVEEMEQND